MAEINDRIKVKLKELEADREARTQAWELVRKKGGRISEIATHLGKVRDRIRRLRAAVAEVLQDLEEQEAQTPDEDTEEEAELRALRDQLAGRLEEAISDRERLLDKLDRVKDGQDDAKQALQKAVDEHDDDREALQRLRRRRKRIQERQERPSKNFAFAEFDCNDGTDLPTQSEPAVRDWCVRIGEKLRERFGSVHVNSGFRHRAYNASIGGEPNSVHIYDYPGRDYKAVAVDFRCASGTPLDWFNFTAGLADGRGRYSTFHHADSRRHLGWPPTTWSG